MASHGVLITPRMLDEHVDRLGERHPPIELDSVDRTVLRPDLVRQQYGHVIDFMSRVELEVDRNVLELLTLLPDPGETDRHFFEDVWQPQEIAHGRILDRMQQDLGMPASQPELDRIGLNIRVLGALAHLRPIQEVARLMYYLTGAATERSAVLAYNRLSAGLERLGEKALSRTAIAPIKRQEPGHFAFYRMSATAMLQQRVLAPWQLRMVRTMRKHAFQLVGVYNREQKADYGGIVVALGLEDDLAGYARDIGVVERDLLWAQHEGMHVPTYVLAGLREAVDAYRERLTRLAASPA